MTARSVREPTPARTGSPLAGLEAEELTRADG
jgi:hypothetical protein